MSHSFVTAVAAAPGILKELLISQDNFFISAEM